LLAAARPAVVPLSFAQSRLWFLYQLQGPSAVYNMAVALRLRGRLDAEVLGAALADVADRHESLRTLFAAVEGVPQQVVIPGERADFGWQVVDATGWSADRLHEAIDTAARHPFDLTAEIPLRAQLFTIARLGPMTSRHRSTRRTATSTCSPSERAEVSFEDDCGELRSIAVMPPGRCSMSWMLLATQCPIPARCFQRGLSAAQASSVARRSRRWPTFPAQACATSRAPSSAHANRSLMSTAIGVSRGSGKSRLSTSVKP
jgi:hypothetical protein